MVTHLLSRMVYKGLVVTKGVLTSVAIQAGELPSTGENNGVSNLVGVNCGVSSLLGVHGLRFGVGTGDSCNVAGNEGESSVVGT